MLFFTKETFVRPSAEDTVSLKGIYKMATSRQMLPLLLTLCAIQLGPQMTQPIIPVYMEEIDPAIKAATMSGVAFCLMGVTSAISSLFAGRIAKRLSLKKMLFFSCIGVGLLYVPPVFANTIVMLIAFIAIIGFINGGLMASSSALIGLSASQSHQGAAYGAAQSANAIGVSIGPLIGGLLAPTLGLRSVYAFGAMIFVLVGLAVNRFLKDVSFTEGPDPAAEPPQTKTA